MGRKKSKSKAVPVPIAWRPVKSQRRARKITSAFHQLTHELTLNSTQRKRTRIGRNDADADTVKAASQSQELAADATAKAQAATEQNRQNSGVGAPQAGLNHDAERLQKQLRELGGRRLYQAASALATARNTSSAKWVFKTLTELGRRPGKRKQQQKDQKAHQGKEKQCGVGSALQAKPRLLEIGAVNTQLLACKWMDVVPIDIRSQHPRIQQINFLEFGDPANEEP